jgi:cytochrome-b5 reductase
MSDSLLARKYFDGIYIPAGLIILGTIIVRREWTPYAVIAAIALGSLKYFNNCMPLPLGPCLDPPPLTFHATVPKKVLKPDAFQEFELKEKTIISHNVAM